MAGKRSNKKPIWKRKVFWILLVLVALAGAGMVWLRGARARLEEAAQEWMDRTQEAEVSYGTIRSTVDGNGNLEVAETFDVIAPTGIRVDSVEVEVGDTVRSGDVIARLNITSIVDALVQIESDVKKIDDDLKEDDDRKSDDKDKLSDLKREQMRMQREELLGYQRELLLLKSSPVILAGGDGVVSQINIEDGVEITKSALPSGSSGTSFDFSNYTGMLGMSQRREPGADRVISLGGASRRGTVSLMTLQTVTPLEDQEVEAVRSGAPEEDVEAAEKAAAEKAAEEKAAAEKAAAEEAAAEKAVAEKAAAEKEAAEKAAEKAAAEKAAAEKEAAEKAAAEKAAAEKEAAEKAAAEKAAAEKEAAEKAAAEKAAAEKEAAEKAAAEKAAAEKEAAEKAAAEKEAAEKEAAEKEAGETEASQAPSTEAPAPETPASETPSAETPAEETPALETPSAEVASEAPQSSEAPSAEQPDSAAPTGEEPQSASPTLPGGLVIPSLPGDIQDLPQGKIPVTNYAALALITPAVGDRPAKSLEGAVEDALKVLNAAGSGSVDLSKITQLSDLAAVMARVGVLRAEDLPYTSSITWKPKDKKFKKETKYKATIKLTAKEGFTFEGFSESMLPDISGASWKSSVGEDGETLTIKATYKKRKAAEAETAPSLGDMLQDALKDSGLDLDSLSNLGNLGNLGGLGDLGSLGNLGSLGSFSMDGFDTANLEGLNGSLIGSSLYSNYRAVVCTVNRQETVKVAIKVDEEDILSVKEGQEAAVTLDALPGKTFQGVISKVATEAEAGTGSAKFAVEVTVPKDEDMRLGMSASVDITVGEASQILVIPILALQQSGEQTFVYTQRNEDGTLGGEREVATGLSDGTLVEITAGLAEGDVIYYTRTGENYNPFGFGNFRQGRWNSGEEDEGV